MKREVDGSGVEEKVGYAMVKARLITDIQLKTALDYQRSLGGGLPDVVVKLGFVRPSALTRFLADANLTETAAPPQKHAGPDEHTERHVAPLLGDNLSEMPTQRPAPAPQPPPAASSVPPDLDPALAALVEVLLHRGIIGKKDRDRVYNAAASKVIG
jgi:hypothetical protein